jgi:hypothetical protein
LLGKSLYKEWKPQFLQGLFHAMYTLSSTGLWYVYGIILHIPGYEETVHWLCKPTHTIHTLVWGSIQFVMLLELKWLNSCVCEGVTEWYIWWDVSFVCCIQSITEAFGFVHNGGIVLKEQPK